MQQTGAEERPAATVAITETEFEISPAEPSADSAGVVRFEVKNDGEIAHALEVEGADGKYETSDIAPGETATLDVELPKGSYTIYCPIGNHRDQGMEGTVSIAGGGGAAPEEDETEEDSGGSNSRGY